MWNAYYEVTAHPVAPRNSMRAVLAIVDAWPSREEPSK